jgi:hypothetical protein
MQALGRAMTPLVEPPPAEFQGASRSIRNMDRDDA